MSHANALRLAMSAGLALALMLAATLVAWKFGNPPELGEAWFGWLYPPWWVWGWWQAWGSQEPYRDTFLAGLSLAGVAFVMPPLAMRMYEMNSPLRVGKIDPVQGFGTVAELVKTGHVHKAGDGVVIGKGGRRVILRDHGDGHVLVMGPSRLGKGAGHVIPTLLSHSGSMLVFDPKHELSAITGRRRAEFGRVVVFDPTDPSSARYNPLLELRAGAQLIGDCQMAATILAYRGQARSDEPFWDDAARNLLTALLVHVRLSIEPTLDHLWHLTLAVRANRYPRPQQRLCAARCCEGHRKLAGKSARTRSTRRCLTHLSFLADPLIQACHQRQRLPRRRPAGGRPALDHVPVDPGLGRQAAAAADAAAAQSA